jgi:hypothetical protein
MVQNMGMRTPIRVYLDSSDYSTLSDPAKLAREAPGVLVELKQLKADGIAEFFYSAAHLTEMAPTKSTYADAAIRRADLLADLCDGNCMIHHETLFNYEVRVALGLVHESFDPIDRNGQWFPEGAIEMSPVRAADRLRAIQDTIAEVLPDATRAQRRQAKRMLSKGGKPRPFVERMLQQNARVGDLSEVLAAYPMRPDAARTLVKYISGHATAGQANEAFETSLRDPRWMMQWFDKHHDKLSPVVAWARGPAATLTGKVMELARLVEATRASAAFTDEALSSMYSHAKWGEWQTTMLVGLANRFAERVEPGVTLNENQIDADCPGISTAVRSLHSAWRSVTFEKPRLAKESDFVDALHAAYAPYVDVFRADGFMAEYIRPRLRRFSTKVVSKLSALPAILRDQRAGT